MICQALAAAVDADAPNHGARADIILTHLADAGYTIGREPDAKQPANDAPHIKQSAEPCDWFLNNGHPNREWCCNTHMYAGGQAGIEGEDHPDVCEFGDLEMPDYIIETTQEFTVTYRVTAESPEAAWNELLDAGFVADSVFQSPGNITGTFDDASIEED